MQELIKARSHLLLDNPFFGVQAMALDLQEKASVGTAATDGKHLYYNREFIESLTHSERIFLEAHEVFHIILGHHIRRNGRDIETWNKAADYAVNQILFQNKIGSVIDGALFDNRFDGQSAESIYKTLYQERQANKKQDKGNGQDKEQKQDKSQADINGQCGGVLDSPELDTGKVQVEQKTMLAQAMQAAKMAGKLPGNIERLVKDILEPKANWKDLLKQWASETLKEDYSYARPSNRSQDFIMPSLSSEGMGLIIYAIDTSGSINKKALAQSKAELNELRRQYQFDCIVIYCDKRIQGIDHFTRYQEIDFNPAGGGGTKFTPVFEYIQENVTQDIAGLIYFTDLYCRDFPKHEQSYPVLWLVYGKSTRQAPMGETVRLDNE